MKYLCYEFTIIQNRDLYSEILIAELAGCGFEMFEETDKGFKGYVPEAQLNQQLLQEIHLLNSHNDVITYNVNVIPWQNWNKEWETHFNPVTIAGAVNIRAEFHKPSPDTLYDIIIQPEMSFGTGHHETTACVVELMLGTDFLNKKVCDMGCGTSVLAILAEKLGAASVEAFDIDAHCIENSKSNLIRNASINISVQQGDANSTANKKYDVFIANINRNILISDMNKYAKALNENGLLIVSGFYDDDAAAIQSEAAKFKLHAIKSMNRNKWCALMLSVSTDALTA